MAAAGLICLAKPGDQVRKGQPLVELRADDPERFRGALAALEHAIEVTGRPPPPLPSPVIDVIGP